MTMTTEDVKLDHRPYAVNTSTVHTATLVNQSIEKMEVRLPATGLPALVSLTGKDIEIPEGSWLDDIAAAVVGGAVIYLTRRGRGDVAVVRAEVVSRLLHEYPAVGDEYPESRTSQDRRTLDDLWLQQGVPLVSDPAELRGEGFSDFDEFLSALKSG
jgi:hypothetical protein